MWVSLEQEDKSRLDKETGGKNASVGVVIIKVRTLVYFIIYKIYYYDNTCILLFIEECGECQSRTITFSTIYPVIL
jgi:hypothetical protein